MTPFKKKTVDSILAAFNFAIRDLEEVETQSQEGVEAADKVIAQKQAEKQAHLAEGSRATAVKEKLKGLIS